MHSSRSGQSARCRGPRDPIPAAPNHNTLAVASSESLQLISSPQSDENWPCREYRPHAFNPPPYVTSRRVRAGSSTTWLVRNESGKLVTCECQTCWIFLWTYFRLGHPLAEDIVVTPNGTFPAPYASSLLTASIASADHPPRGLWVVLPHRRLPPDYTPATLPHYQSPESCTTLNQCAARPSIGRETEDVLCDVVSLVTVSGVVPSGDR
ncbi:hypothetical protein BJ912DRAFT_392792 [Pholiota molesta]|nr:hypothetical protein BJ912DRAFT_392792 [Pholiota molesta]